MMIAVSGIANSLLRIGEWQELEQPSGHLEGVVIPEIEGIESGVAVYIRVVGINPTVQRLLHKAQYNLTMPS